MTETNASDDQYIPPDRLVPPPRPVPPSRAVMAERRREVRDPATTLERLPELAAKVDAFPGERPRFAAALAANPNVPTDLIARYLYLAPGAFRRNPALAELDLAEFFRDRSRGPNYPRLTLPWNGRGTLYYQHALFLGLARLLRSPRAPRSLVVALASQRLYPYLASTAQFHVAIAREIAPETIDTSLAEYWTDALASELNKVRGKLLRQLFYYDLAPAALRALLPESLKAERNLSEETGRWTESRSNERWWSELNQTLAVGRMAGETARVEELTRLNLIRMPLNVEEPGLLDEPSATVLLYRTLALFRASDVRRRALTPQFAESALWQDRIAASLVLRPFPGEDRLRPRYQTLLHRLAADGNRYVRAVARRRLVEPDWRFPYF